SSHDVINLFLYIEVKAHLSLLYSRTITSLPLSFNREQPGTKRLSWSYTWYGETRLFVATLVLAHQGAGGGCSFRL
nr:hypothetical protein [Tanacetum cinerariifolium]